VQCFIHTTHDVRNRYMITNIHSLRTNTAMPTSLVRRQLDRVLKRLFPNRRSSAEQQHLSAQEQLVLALGKWMMLAGQRTTTSSPAAAAAGATSGDGGGSGGDGGGAPRGVSDGSAASLLRLSTIDLEEHNDGSMSSRSPTSSSSSSSSTTMTTMTTAAAAGSTTTRLHLNSIQTSLKLFSVKVNTPTSPDNLVRTTADELAQSQGKLHEVPSEVRSSVCPYEGMCGKAYCEVG
jgi:hypothetical protein